MKKKLRTILYRSERKNAKNGGALLYVHESIIVDNYAIFDNGTCNAVICLCTKSNAIICCVYRPPCASQESFTDLLNFVSNFIIKNDILSSTKILMFGDFNFPEISWKEDQVTEYVSPSAITLKSFVDKFLLSQYVRECTRKMNILDLFYTNDFNFVQHVEIDKVQYSDHNLIKIFTSFSHNLDTDSGCVIEDNVDCDFSKFNYSTTDFGAVNLELSSINWRSIITGNIDDIPSKLNKTVFF